MGNSPADASHLDQGHIVQHLQRLAVDDPEAAQRLGAAMAKVDWAELAAYEDPAAPSSLLEARVVGDDERARRQQSLCAVGEGCYRAGQVAVLVVAGGQGTRLGFDGPKGCFVIDEAAGTSIYELHAQQVAAASKRYGVAIPLLIMTSPHTDAPTRAFFAQHDNFGLADDQVRFFSQGTVPSLTIDGHALLAAPDRLLENPDGHGGCFTALVDSGLLAELDADGVQYILYLQVDNVLARADDTFAIGLAAEDGLDAVTKVLPKRDPDERVGHLVRAVDADGNERDRIVEYTELSAEDVRRTRDDGSLLFGWGNTAMHIWRVGYLQELVAFGLTLPLHRSKKPLKSWTADGEAVVDGYKCERFIFDLLLFTDASAGLAVRRENEFSPVKNATGTDSPATARAALKRATVGV